MKLIVPTIEECEIILQQDPESKLHKFLTGYKTDPNFIETFADIVNKKMHLNALYSIDRYYVRINHKDGKNTGILMDSDKKHLYTITMDCPDKVMYVLINKKNSLM